MHIPAGAWHRGAEGMSDGTGTMIFSHSDGECRIVSL